MLPTTQTFYDYSTYKYRYTKPQYTINTIDLKAKTSISNLSVNAYTYFESNQLKNNVETAPIFATTELNEFLLDGSRELLPQTPTDEELGWWSELSDSEGFFLANPQLTIEFSSIRSSIGLTFFYDLWAYPLEYKVRWYYNATLLKETTLTGDSAEQVADIHVQGYNKIELEIVRAKPYSMIKLLEIDYGYKLNIDSSKTKGGKLKEEVSLISNQLVSNTLSFSMFNYSSKYNLLNPEDVMVYFSQGQEVDVKCGVKNLSTNAYEFVDMGKYYLNTVQNKNGVLEVSCSGVLDILNQEIYYSQFFDNETVETILADLLDGYSYYINDNVKDVRLTGYIAKRNKKEALKTVLLASNSIVKEGRDGTLYIFKPTEELSNNQLVTEDTIYTRNGLAPFMVANEMYLQDEIKAQKDFLKIKREQRMSQIDITRIPYYHKVEVKQLNYTKDGSVETLFDDDVITDNEGVAVINFNQAVYDLTVPTSLDYTIYTFADCCVLVGGVNETYHITITGKKYTITESIVSATRDLDENLGNEPREVMTIDTFNTLIGTLSTAQACASWYLSQLKKRLDVSFSWWSVATAEASDYVILIDSFNNSNQLQISSIEYDLANLIAEVKGVI